MSPPTDYTLELRVATQIIHRASVLTKQTQTQSDKGSQDKEDASPVTIADFAAQAIIIHGLTHRFPDDAIVGEESAATLRADTKLADRVWELVSQARERHANDNDALFAMPASQKEMLDAIDMGGDGEGVDTLRRTWVLDPIDGTKTFIRGQQYAVSVAMVQDGEQKVGVVGYPNIKHKGWVHEDAVDKSDYGTLVSAVKGQGTLRRRMTEHAVSDVADKIEHKPGTLDNIVWAECFSSPYLDLDRQKEVRRRLHTADAPVTDLYSMQCKYGALTVGLCTAMVRLPTTRSYRTYAWDHAGGMLAFEESGGVVTDIYGQPFKYVGRKLTENVGMVAAMPEVHAQVLKVARQVFDETWW